MRKYIFTLLSVVALLIISYLIFQRYFSPNSLGRKVFEAIEKDDLSYIKTADSFLVSDTKQLTTTDLLCSMLLESGKKVTLQDLFDKEFELFQFPNSVRKFKLLETETQDIHLNKNVDLSKSVYEDNEYSKSEHKSYEEFVKSEVKLYSQLDSFKYDKENTQIIYESSYKKTSLKYKVETPLRDLIVNMIFLKEEHHQDHKLAAMYIN